MKLQTARSATLGVLGLGSTATVLAILCSAGQLSFGLLLFALWALYPYLVLDGALRWLVRGVGTAAFVLLASVVVGVFGTVCYFGAFIAHPDAQSGLAFIFVPAYQTIVALIVFGVLGAVRLILGRAPNAS